jgi:hypothetical protein
MLKRPPHLLDPDPRFQTMVGGLYETGQVRPMSIKDLYDLVTTFHLNAAVPHDIAEQFDKARHAFIHSWFAYDLVSLAEQQAYQVVELALRGKLSPDERARASKERWGLKKLLDCAVAHQWLSREAFTTSAPWGRGASMCALDIFVRGRNELAH